MRTLLLALIILSTLSVPALAATDTVLVTNFFFSPANLTISKGDTVVWTFAGVPHTTSHNVALVDRIWDSGTLSAGQTFTFVFDTVGTFPYRCDIHSLTMLATLTVEDIPTNVTHQVTVGSFFFSPDTLHINQGDTVVWTIDDAVMPHTATHDVPAPLRLFDSGLLTNGQSFSYVFDTSGVFPVFCTVHPNQMSQMIFSTGGPECPDADLDGVCDFDDNCPSAFNNRQENEDGDAFGDLCDACLGDPTNTCAPCVSGDVNSNGSITSADIIYLVGFVFKGGPAPQPVVEAGDVNCSGAVTSADIIYLVGFVFKGGPAPCASC